MREEQIVLEDDADRAGLGRRTVQQRTVQCQMARRERGEAREGAQGGGLAGAVGAEQRDDVAGGGGERDIEAEGAAVDDEVGVEAFGQEAGCRVVAVGRLGHEVYVQGVRRPSSSGRAGPRVPRWTRPAAPG